MPRIKQTTVFQFNELSDTAKERARQKYREQGFDYEWYGGTFDDAKNCLNLAGFKIERIFFSGFSSQGDGACFEGTWSAEAARPVKAMKQHAPTDKRLHAIAAAAREIAKRDKAAYAVIEHRGHYYHEYETDFSVDYERDDTEAAVVEVSREAMRWIYRRLEAEYDWLNADEQIDDSIRANEYEFNADGSLA